jgi:hypothetical protein
MTEELMRTYKVKDADEARRLIDRGILTFETFLEKLETWQANVDPDDVSSAKQGIACLKRAYDILST